MTRVVIRGGPYQFYAAIDTGATRTICSRRLAEVLFGKWLPCDEKSFKMFNGDLVRYEVMTELLELQAQDESVVSFGTVNFVDQKLPFSNYLPQNDDLPEEIDMIIGSDCVWQHVFSQLFLSKTSNFLLSGQRINLNIGQLWLGTASQSYSSINHITTIHQPAIIAKRNEVARDESCYNRADNSKVRLTRDDRAEDLKKLENDPFFLSNNDERITISNQDEAVLNHYRNTVEEIKLDNGETHLQFRLPWAKDPTTMKDNFEQAKDALLRTRKKMSS